MRCESALQVDQCNITCRALRFSCVTTGASLLKVMLHWSTCNANLQRRFATHVFCTNLQTRYTFESLSKTSNALQQRHIKHRTTETNFSCSLPEILLHTVRRTWLSIASGNLDPRNEVELADERSYATIIPFELFFSNNQDSYKEVSVYIAGQRVTRYSSPRIIAPRLGLSVDIVYLLYMAQGSVHKMARSDWLVTGPYFRVRTREMDPVRWTAPNNLCRKLRSCMSDSGCVILTEPEESYKNILRKSTLWHPFCKTTAKSTEEVS